MNDFKFIWKLITGDEKKRLFFILLLIIGSSFIEFLGVASIMPFLTVLGKPSIIHENEWLSKVFNELSFESDRNFTIFLGVVICFIYIIRAIYNIIVTRERLVFSNEILKTSSKKLLETYLSISFLEYLQSNTSIMMKNITKEINVIRTSLLMMIEIIKELATFIVISITLFFIEPQLTFFSGIVFVSTVLLVSKITKLRLVETGRAAEKSNRFVFKTGNEAITGYKEIVLSQNYKYFIKTFMKNLDVYTKCNIRLLLLKVIPTITIEAVFSVSIIVFVFYLMATRESLVEVLPLLGLYAMAAQRVIPSLNKINGGVAQLRSIKGGVEALRKEFSTKRRNITDRSYVEKKTLKKRVLLNDVSFKYDENKKNALSNVTLEISKGDSIGIVGGSGSGKTTLIHAFLGLLSPDSGEVILDDESLNEESFPGFQKNISYIPQNIFLIDDTVLANIAFGIPQDEIDFSKIDQVLEDSQLVGLVEKLPNGIHEIIGDKGARLSGGEKQRIGIARALYLDSEIIVLDEATSALDNETEQKFQQSIEKISKTKTMITIAHRISTIRNCDRIIIMKNGSIVGEGRYENLLQNNQEFLKISQLGERN
ncbi:MAG: ABC transporter ATP-binding protein [Oligoflexia bacterium]|nr:ABC transporter ATP-binding protein [Oligoflexia bacterium]